MDRFVVMPEVTVDDSDGAEVESQQTNEVLRVVLHVVRGVRPENEETEERGRRPYWERQTKAEEKINS